MITALVAHTSFLFVNKSLPARLVCSLASPKDDRFSPKLLTGGNCLIPPPFIFPCCKLYPEGIIQWILTSGRKHSGLPCSLKKHLLLREKWGGKDPEAQLPEIPGRHRRAQIPVQLPNKTNPLAWRIPVSFISDATLDSLPIVTGLQLKKLF